MQLATKIKVYSAVVLPTLLYGCEAWTPYRRHIRRLDQFHVRCLRCIANIKWQDMIPNTEVLQRCTQNVIEHHIKRAQLRWSGHLVSMADDRIPKTVFYGELGAGHRTRGGQRSHAAFPTPPGRPPQLSVPSGVVPAIPVYDTMKRRGATP